MSIDIRDIQANRQPVGQRSAGAVAAREDLARGSGAKAGATGTGDRVELSAEARQLRALSESAAAAPEVDTAKMEQIRQQIAEGRYHVDPQKLADRLLQLERGLLG